MLEERNYDDDEAPILDELAAVVGTALNPSSDQSSSNNARGHRQDRQVAQNGVDVRVPDASGANRLLYSARHCFAPHAVSADARICPARKGSARQPRTDQAPSRSARPARQNDACQARASTPTTRSDATIFTEEIIKTRGSGHSAPDALGIGEGWGDEVEYRDVLVSRAMAMRATLHAAVADDALFARLDWIDADMRGEVSELLFPGGAPEPGDERWMEWEEKGFEESTGMTIVSWPWRQSFLGGGW